MKKIFFNIHSSFKFFLTKISYYWSFFILPNLLLIIVSKFFGLGFTFAAIVLYIWFLCDHWLLLNDLFQLCINFVYKISAAQFAWIKQNSFIGKKAELNSFLQKHKFLSDIRMYKALMQKKNELYNFNDFTLKNELYNFNDFTLKNELYNLNDFTLKNEVSKDFLKWVEGEKIKDEQLNTQIEQIALNLKRLDASFDELIKNQRAVLGMNDLVLRHMAEEIKKSMIVIGINQINKNLDKTDVLFVKFEQLKNSIDYVVDPVKNQRKSLLEGTRQLISMYNLNENDPKFLNKLIEQGAFFEKSEKEFSSFNKIQNDYSCYEKKIDESRFCITSQIQKDEKEISSISKNLGIDKEKISKIFQEQKVKNLVQDLIDSSNTFSKGDFLYEIDETFGQFYIDEIIGQLKQIDEIEKSYFEKESRFFFANKFFVKYHESSTKLHAHSHYTMGYSLLFNKNSDYINTINQLIREKQTLNFYETKLKNLQNIAKADLIELKKEKKALQFHNWYDIGLIEEFDNSISQKESELSKVSYRLEKTALAHRLLDKEIHALDIKHENFQDKISDYFTSFFLLFTWRVFYKPFTFKWDRKKIIIILRLISLALSVLLWYHPTPIGVELLDFLKQIYDCFKGK